MNSEKPPFDTGDLVVYPTHGVGKIVAIETQEISGHTLSVFVVHHQGRLGLLRLAFAALLGRLDRNSSIEYRRAAQLVIETHRRTVLVACDGETHVLASPLTYRILPGALRVLAPE